MVKILEGEGVVHGREVGGKSPENIGGDCSVCKGNEGKGSSCLSYRVNV